jgi:H+/Cl- antiporter ClcA
MQVIHTAQDAKTTAMTGTSPNPPRRLPWLSITGLLVIGAGLALNVIVLLTLPAAVHEHGHSVSGLSEHTAHLVVLVGMALTLAGVVIDGARRQFRQRPAPVPTERSHGHAHR